MSRIFRVVDFSFVFVPVVGLGGIIENRDTLIFKSTTDLQWSWSATTCIKDCFPTA